MHKREIIYNVISDFDTSTIVEVYAGAASNGHSKIQSCNNFHVNYHYLI
jgi:hypothetical protein